MEELDLPDPDEPPSPPKEPQVETPEQRAAALRAQRTLKLLTVLLTVCPTLVVAALARTNPYVEPGHEGYIYERPRIFGHGGFQGTVMGPGNFGLSLFRNEAIALDMRPQTHSEEFEVLAQDDLTLQFKFHAVISIEQGSVVRVVNEYGGLDWYPRFVAEPFRSFVRDAVQQYRSTDLKTTMDDCARIVHERLERYLEKTPFKLVNLAVGNINYPPVVAQAVERKLAAQQLLVEKDTQQQIALKDAAIEVDRAKGKAEAQRIISSTLTSHYLQHEAIDAQKKMAESPNHSTIYIPLGPTGMPMVYTPDRTR
jgi:regulator of protease activity HflC (stomatin/prohibitin superfamily)